jgi:hypothetical protein
MVEKVYDHLREKENKIKKEELNENEKELAF